MTRRRPRGLLFSPGGRNGVGIVCADRGQHDEISLGGLSIIGEHVYANNGFRLTNAAERLKHKSVYTDARQRVHLACPRCRRHIEWTNEKAVGILRRLEAAGIETLDIASIP